MRTTPVKSQTLLLHFIRMVGGTITVVFNPYAAAAALLVANLLLLVGVAFRKV